MLCFVFISLFPAIAYTAAINSPCTTPNGEVATCISVYSCSVITAALTSSNKTVSDVAKDFAKQSQCGYDKNPLVCCGSHAHFSKIPDIFTPEVTTAANKPDLTSEAAVKPIEPIISNLLPDRSICGLEREHERLIGGELTAIGEFPWMALIGYKHSDGKDAGFNCGGSLVTSHFVLTAAHCVRGTFQANFNVDNVRLGEWNTSSITDCVKGLANDECADPVLDVKVKEAIPHPYYSSISGNNDIALLRLENNIDYTEFIRPICLPPANLQTPAVGTMMTVSGWGNTENGTQSDVKLRVDVPLVSNTQCASKLDTLRTRISANQLCAGGIEGKDACKGDSGGPLMRTYENPDSIQQQWYQEGVVSRGVGCGRRGYPGVYTRVSRYLNWILSNID